MHAKLSSYDTERGSAFANTAYPLSEPPFWYEACSSKLQGSCRYESRPRSHHQFPGAESPIRYKIHVIEKFWFGHWEARQILCFTRNKVENMVAFTKALEIESWVLYPIGILLIFARL